MKELARGAIRRIGRQGDFGASSVVQDAVVHLLQRNGIQASNRAEFFYVLRRAIRDVLVERLRSADALKRGGGALTVSLEHDLVEAKPGDPLGVGAEAVLNALEELERVEPHSAAAFMLVDWYGATLHNAAATLDRTFSQVRDDRDFARVWLRRFLRHQERERDKS